MFFDARNVDGEADLTYSAADLAALTSAYYGDGVLSRDALAVEARNTLAVDVTPGAAVIKGYSYVLDARKTIALEAVGSNPRVDLIVLRLDLGERAITAGAITGTPAATPAAPSYSSSGTVVEMPLAKIELPAGAQSAAAGTLTDLRTSAAVRVMEGTFLAMLEAAFAAAPMLTAGELAAAKRLISAIDLDGDGTKVLCSDGAYRPSAATERVELVRYDRAGEYEFDPAEYPSATGTYDVEIVGAGGGGGSVLTVSQRGGGGGAGAWVSETGVRPGGVTAVKVGAGGGSGPGYDGISGEDSSFGNFFAEGGHGGRGGESVSGGDGGWTGAFRASDGENGSRNVGGETHLDECGAGGASVFGAGAPGDTSSDVASFGKNAANPGAGGSGAGGPQALSVLLSGGRGADGAVIVYGYAVIGAERS